MQHCSPDLARVKVQYSKAHKERELGAALEWAKWSSLTSPTVVWQHYPIDNARTRSHPPRIRQNTPSQTYTALTAAQENKILFAL